MNTRYLSSNRGIIKIVQIVLGFVVCSLLCTSWYGGRSCFGEGRIGFCSALNFVALIINLVLFIVNLLNISTWKMERIYSAVCMILFLIASILIIWFMIEMNTTQTSFIITTICLVVVCFLFLWDLKILQGEASN